MRPRLAIAAERRARDRRHARLQPGNARRSKRCTIRAMVAVVQGVGYPDPDHSHFRSTEIWQTAAPEQLRAHRLARPLSRRRGTCRAKNLFNGVAISQRACRRRCLERTDIPADCQRQRLRSGDRRPHLAARNASRARRKIARSLSIAVSRARDGDRRSRAARFARSCRELDRRLQDARPPIRRRRLGRSLALAAQIVGSNLGTRVLYVAARLVRHARQPKGDARSTCSASSPMRSPPSTTISPRTATSVAS